MLYTISQLTQLYQNRTVLNIESMTIADGAIYGLLGPNGAGKTTLLNILGFLLPPTSGQITFRSKAVRFHEASLRILRRQVVLVDQHPILFTTTVRKNIEFGLKVRNVSAKKRGVIVDEALDLVGMREFDKARANRLSGGETQRVAIARALAVNPDVFLCDEPTSSVDVENQATILNILKRINAEKKKGVIFTTHDTRQAYGLAHHILFLESGRLTEKPQENIFSATAVKDAVGQWQCKIQDVLRLPLENFSSQHASAKLKVHIDPQRLRLETPDHDDSSGLVGKIVQLGADNGHIRVVVDVGIWLSLSLKPDVYKKRPPLIGEAVKVLGLAKALKLLP
jgi:tungstate transport system ATP-binding protein